MSKSQKTILIVDDEPEIRGLMQEILTEEGYLTFAVKNAKEAQNIIVDNPPDLVYLDISVSYTHLTLPTNREV